MGIITDINRADSLLKTDKKTRQTDILKAWEGEMSADDVREKLGFTDMNSVRPRITELVKMGLLEECGRKLNQRTDRRVTVWKKTY